MINIRKVKEKDLPAIQALAKEIWPAAYGDILSAEQLTYMLDTMYSIPSLTKQLNHLNHCFYVASDETLPVGFVSISSDKENSSVFILQKIYVLPKYQGKQVGNALLDEAKRHALAGKGVSLRLNVNRYNPALKFYEKKGFKVIDSVDIDIGKGYFMNDYVMACPL